MGVFLLSRSFFAFHSSISSHPVPRSMFAFAGELIQASAVNAGITGLHIWLTPFGAAPPFFGSKCLELVYNFIVVSTPSGLD